MNSTRQAEIASMVCVQAFLKANPSLKENNEELTTESDSMDVNLKLALAAGDVKVQNPLKLTTSIRFKLTTLV